MKLLKMRMAALILTVAFVGSCGSIPCFASSVSNRASVETSQKVSMIQSNTKHEANTESDVDTTSTDADSESDVDSASTDSDTESDVGSEPDDAWVSKDALAKALFSCSIPAEGKSFNVHADGSQSEMVVNIPRGAALSLSISIDDAIQDHNGNVVSVGNGDTGTINHASKDEDTVQKYTFIGWGQPGEETGLYHLGRKILSIIIDEDNFQYDTSGVIHLCQSGSKYTFSITAPKDWKVTAIAGGRPTTVDAGTDNTGKRLSPVDNPDGTRTTYLTVRARWDEGSAGIYALVNGQSYQIFRVQLDGKYVLNVGNPQPGIHFGCNGCDYSCSDEQLQQVKKWCAGYNPFKDKDAELVNWTESEWDDRAQYYGFESATPEFKRASILIYNLPHSGAHGIPSYDKLSTYDRQQFEEWKDMYPDTTGSPGNAWIEMAGGGVCSDRAKARQAFLQTYGMDCRLVSIASADHMWFEVKIDGQWCMCQNYGLGDFPICHSETAKYDSGCDIGYNLY